MRAREEVQAAMVALGRPPFPRLPTPEALARWRPAITAWREAYPEGDAQYQALLDELEAIDARAAVVRTDAETLQRVSVPRVVACAAAVARDEAPVVTVREWWASPKPWCLLLGGTGTGKSTAAAVGLLQALRSGKSALWLPAVELTARAGGFDGVAFADKAKHVEVLVLDDLGVEHAGDFGRSVMAEVLLHRHEDGGRTIVTSNLDKPALARRVGPRLVDRWRGASVSGEYGGPSLRGVA